MKYNIYLFDLDGTLLHLGNMGVYVDQILTDTLKRLDASYFPIKNEKYRLWASEEEFFNALNEWGVKEPQNFWKVFDEIDLKWRKELIEKNLKYSIT